MSHRQPLVTIGMPVYNAGQMVRGAVESLLAQTVEDFELVICDNASTDNTCQILREYAAGDNRVRLHRNSANLGALGNFDRTVDLARGRFFAWASHDDLWEPGFLEACLAPLERPGVILAFPNTRIITHDGRPEGFIKHDEQLTTEGIASPTRRLARVMSRGDLWVLFYGLMDTGLVRRAIPLARVHSPDSVFVMLMALLGQFVHVPEVLFTFRSKKESAKVRQSKGFMGEKEYRAVQRYTSWWPTTMAFCRRAWRVGLRPDQKALVSLRALRWYVSESRLLPAGARTFLRRLLPGLAYPVDESA